MLIFAGGDVFGKQARLVFAEFLPFLLVFPIFTFRCGVNDVGVWKFLVILYNHSALFGWVR